MAATRSTTLAPKKAVPHRGSTGDGAGKAVVARPGSGNGAKKGALPKAGRDRLRRSFNMDSN